MKQKINSEEVKTLTIAIDTLIEIKVLIRKLTPSYELDYESNKKLLDLLKVLYSMLQPIFNKYITSSSDIEANKNELNDIIDIIKSNSLIIVSANSLKKKLKNHGVDPRQLIVTGGPLFIENYEKINPKISHEVFLNIKKKCENLVSQIKNLSKLNNEITFLYKKVNLTDQIILKELDELEKIVKKKIRRYEVKILDI
ncbi:MAG: DUF2100 domain-containing protein [Promethearchaeota archaeon]